MIKYFLVVINPKFGIFLDFKYFSIYGVKKRLQQKASTFNIYLRVPEESIRALKFVSWYTRA